MIIISDSTPLINFAKLGRLDLLQKLFEKVYIPEAVYYEVVIEGEDRPGAVEVKTATWIERCLVSQEFIDKLRFRP
jgi:predicted nucleic acid-binding protein